MARKRLKEVNKSTQQLSKRILKRGRWVCSPPGASKFAQSLRCPIGVGIRTRRRAAKRALFCGLSVGLKSLEYSVCRMMMLWGWS